MTKNVVYFFIDPISRPEVPKLELHAQMEVKLGIF